jgi:hypothetical protein
MSEFSHLQDISEAQAQTAIAQACLDGCRCCTSPQAAAQTVIDRLSTLFSGAFIQKVIALIKSGLTNLPAILAALKEAGITLPSWANVVIEILLAIVPATA